MPVTIKKVVDGDLADIEAKRYNIFVPISLGNLYFTRNRVRELVQWALKYTRERVVILVADDIHAINYEVLHGLWEDEARKSAHKLGNDFVRMAERVVRSLPQEDQQQASVVRWADIEDNDFKAMQNIVKDEYENNKQFQRKVHEIVRATFEGSPLNENEIHRLGDYVVAELPLMFKGIVVNGVRYEVFLYPGLSELDMLVSDIQNRRQFADIADKLELTEKQPMIEAYVEE